jgi:hypothetical protein
MSGHRQALLAENEATKGCGANDSSTANSTPLDQAGGKILVESGASQAGHLASFADAVA